MTDGAINQAALDRFTSAHAGVGITMAAFGIPWWATLLSTIGWELIENKLKDARPDLFPYSSHDSFENSVADSTAVMLGFWVARHAMRRGLSPEGKAALTASVGATLGAFAGSMSFGVVGKALGATQTTMERGLAIQSHGRAGYHLGCGLGAALGIWHLRAAHTAPVAAGGFVGGATGGPLGAALGAYMATGIAQDLENAA